jgi:hypothetical protein
MRKFTLVFLFLIPSLILSSQNAVKVDSIIRLREKNATDTIRIRYDFEIVQLLYKTQPDSAIEYCKGCPQLGSEV